MSFITNTDNSRLDLSDEPEFMELIENRRELSVIEKEGRDATKKRQELDKKIIDRLGNHKMAIVGDHLIAIKTVMRPERTVRGCAFKTVIVL